MDARRRPYQIIMALMGAGLLAFAASGCVPPLVISEVAGGTVPVAFSSSGRGRAESYWVAAYDDVVVAVLRTQKALALEVKEKKVKGDETFFRLSDSAKDRIDLIVKRRSAKVTSIRFDVGWFRSLAFGRLVARQIIFELDKAGAFPVDWTPVKTDW